MPTLVLDEPIRKPTLVLDEPQERTDPELVYEQSGKIYDTAVENNVPINQVEVGFKQRAKDYAKEVANPFLGVAYKAAESWERGWANVSIDADKVLGYFKQTLPDMSYNPEFLQNAADVYNTNADYWSKRANDVGVTAVNEFLGELGGVPAQATEFLLFKPLVAGVLGAAEAREEGKSEIVGFLLGAMQRKALGKMFEILAPYKASIKVPTAATIGATQAYAQGGDTKDIFKSGATMALLSLGGDGQVGLKDFTKKMYIPPDEVKARAKLTEKPSEPVQAVKESIQGTTVPAETIKEISRDVAKGKGTKERKFITRLKEEVPEIQVESQYEPESSIELSIKAKNLITDNIVEAEAIARKGDSNVSTVIAGELINHYSNMAKTAPTLEAQNALYDKAADIALNTARKLTEHGRAVEAAKIMGKQTPEGQLRFAVHEIEKYNQQIEQSRGITSLKKKIPQLNSNQTKHILNEMKAIQEMPEGDAKSIRFMQLQNFISDLVPSSVYQQIITVWKAGLVTGIRTSGLNIASNAAFGITEKVKDIPATIVDQVAEIFTGERTTTVSVKGAVKGFKEGILRAARYMRTGYDTRDVGSKLEYVRTNFGSSPAGRALKAYTETVFRGLGAQDQPYYYAAAYMSLYEQAKVVAINEGLKGKKAQARINGLIADPTQRMAEYAARDGEAAVFINKTILGSAVKTMIKIPVVGAAVEVAAPFPRTPSALAMEIVNYSPIGIVKTITESINGGKFDQRTFSKGMGRGITGTAVLYIGAQLFSKGLMTLDRPKDEREHKLRELEGKPDNSILIGNTWRSVQTFGPVGNLLLIGGHFQRAFDESGSPTEAMVNAVSGSAKSFTEQTFLRGISQITEAISDPERSAVSYTGNLAASTVPTIVKDIAVATDEFDRRATTIGEKVQARIPGLRENLEPKITVLGEEKTPTANPLELMIDPSRPSEQIETPVVNELRRLWDEGYKVSPTLLGDKDGYDCLSKEDNTKLWQRSGLLIKDVLTSIVTNPSYPTLTDEMKTMTIERVVNELKEFAKTEMVISKLKGMQGQEFIDQLIEFRKSGLAPAQEFPIPVPMKED